MSDERQCYSWKSVKLFECKNCIVNIANERKVVLEGLDSYIVTKKEQAVINMPTRRGTTHQGVFTNIRK